MVMNRFHQLFASLLLLLTWVTPAVMAQQELQMGPPRIDPNGYDPDLSQPFIEPFAFDPDFQFFAPSGVDRLGGEIDPSIGWFASYDRTCLYVTRPQDEATSTQGDFGWGNRFDIGYMTEEEHGWMVSFLHLDGPNNYRILEMERIDVFNPDDLVNSVANADELRGGGGGGGGGNAAVTVTPGFPVRDRNDPITQARDYRLHDSINVAKVSSFELNKTFRIDPLHYGSIVEPFVGVRYSTVNDYYRRDRYQRIDETTGAVVFDSAIPGIFPTLPAQDIDDASMEQLISTNTQFDNNLFGGQIGLRWFKQKSRWNLSAEVKALAFQNFQSFNRTTDTERTYYDGGIQGEVDVVLNTRNVASGHSAEFVFGTEIRAEAAYSITKYMQLRAGIQFMDLARGIGRGNDALRNDQDFLMVGATGGFAINR